jgi:hypothetical protein
MAARLVGIAWSVALVAAFAPRTSRGLTAATTCLVRCTSV